MKFETVTVTQRKNMGNYEHLEITTTARIDEGEDFVAMAMTARTYVDAVLNMPLDAVQAKQEPVTYDEETGQNSPVSEVKEKKEKKPRAPKNVAKATQQSGQKDLGASTEDSQKDGSGQIVPTSASHSKSENKKPYVKYDSNVAEHKSIFGGYLNKKYGNAWKEAKPKEEIQSFTKALNGKEFLDDAGQIVESFLNEVHSFFGN